MPDATANGIRIEHDTFGDDSHPALLLIADNGTQTIFRDAGLKDVSAAMRHDHK